MNYADNIERVFLLAEAGEIDHGNWWYAEAKHECQLIADSCCLPLSTVVGVVAALSPTNKWERNLVDAAALCAAFVDGGYTDDISVCTYGKMKEKAVRILEEGPTCNAAIKRILNGPKITDFFSCIMGENVCVIDGHAWGIANNDRRTMQEVPNIGKKLRAELQAAYAEVGEKYGRTAYQMQAITWVTWKRIWGV